MFNSCFVEGPSSSKRYILLTPPLSSAAPLCLQAPCVGLLLLGGQGDGLVQRGGEGGQPDEVPVLPVPLGPLDVVPDPVRRRGGLPKVDHPNVGLSAVVVDKEERAADHLAERGKHLC